MTLITTTANPIDALRVQVAKYVSGFEFFSNIPVLINVKGDIESQLNNSLLSLGLGLVCDVTKGRPRHKGVGPNVMDLSGFITVIENVGINRDENNRAASGKTASDVICELYAIFNPNERSCPITLADYDELPAPDGQVQYRINFTATAGWSLKK